jgi:hypothetical protein
MGLKVTNNAFGTLNASINSSATTIVLVAGQGARFPTLSAGDYFYATLIDTSNNLEIVKCTARSTDTLTVVRGQDGTTARAYATNDRFELRPTAVMLNEITTIAESALPKAGGTLTGRTIVSVSTGQQLTLAQWGDASSADGGQTMVAGNAYFDKSSGAAKFSNSHGTIGATGIRFNSPSWNEGSLFTAGVTGSTAGNTFTPVDALLWDTAGRIRMPLQPAFKAGRSGAYVPGANTDILFNDTGSGSTHFNTGGHYNTSTGRFTAPVTGVYFITACIIYEQVPSGFSMSDCFYLYKNGGLVAYSFRRAIAVSGSTMEGIYYTDHANVIVQLAAGDYMTVRNNYASRYVHGNTNYSWFAGYLLG